MPSEVIGNGMLARAFASAAATGPKAIICASGVSDSGCSDPFAFRREQVLVNDLTRRARARDAVPVYFSGAPVYGRATGLRAETAKATPETPYGHHKFECEKLVADSGARYLVLRLPNVVGPGGHPRQLVPSLVAQTLNGSVAKVRGLLPEYPRFEPDYPVNILDRRVPALARALMDGATR